MYIFLVTLILHTILLVCIVCYNYSLSLYSYIATYNNYFLKSHIIIIMYIEMEL